MKISTFRRLGAAAAATSLVVLACGSGAATPAASAGQSAAATLALPSLAVPSIVIPSIAIPSIAIPSIALPSGSFDLSSFTLPSEDKDLEARLPSTVNGVTMTKYSFKGATFLGSGASNSQDLIDLLAQLGKTPADLSVAAATDGAGALDVQIGAFRVNGADSNALLAGFLVATRKETPEDVITQTNVGGKNVTQIVDPTDTKAGTVYVFASGDVLFYVVSSDPNLAASVLAGLS